jgi:acyl carrier protein
MSQSVDEVKKLIVSCCPPTGRLSDRLPDDFDLRAEGVVDSLGFVALLTEIETRLGAQIDFDGLDAEDLTRIGPLARYIAERV